MLFLCFFALLDLFSCPVKFAGSNKVVKNTWMAASKSETPSLSNIPPAPPTPPTPTDSKVCCKKHISYFTIYECVYIVSGSTIRKIDPVSALE